MLALPYMVSFLHNKYFSESGFDYLIRMLYWICKSALFAQKLKYFFGSICSYIQWLSEFYTVFPVHGRHKQFAFLKGEFSTF